MKYEIHFLAEAEGDLEDLDRYISLTDSPEKADVFLDGLYAFCKKLEKLPYRGHVNPELAALGYTEYREIHYHSYRVIYQVISAYVYVHAVLDGRRSLESILERRFLRVED